MDQAGRGANGRARGRARGADQARRPGEGGNRGDPAAAAQLHPGQGNGGGGRRNHRGVPRVDPVPAEQRPPVAEVAEAMAAASISDAGGRGRSRPRDEPTRPQHIADKRGKDGEKITVLTNYFELISKPTFCIYQYHCDFSPDVESSKMRKAFIRDHKETLGIYLFDGMSDLKTPSQLGENVEFFSKRLTDGENIRITLKRVNELAPRHPELQRLFNTQMRKNLEHLKFKLLGRHFFDPYAISEVEKINLQIWPGVITSIRQHEENVMMCVDTVHKVVRKETALDVIRNIVTRERANYKDAVVREMVGSVVMTAYNNRTYRVEDVDWSLNPTMTFEHRKGPMKYLDYYKGEYNINIADHKQPLLLCISKEKEIRRGASVSKKVYLVPELCAMTGLTDAMRSNFSTMRELGSYTRVEPAKRVDNLLKFINRIHSNEAIKSEMNAWGIAFSKNLVQIQARIVPHEDIIMKSIVKPVPRDKDFTMLVRSDPMHVSVDLNSWLIVFPQKCRAVTNEMLNVLTRVASNLGMRIKGPTLCEIRDDRIHTYFNAFKDNFNYNATQLVMFILPNNKKERYDALKKYTCVDSAVPSQVIVERTISKPKNLMTVCTKVAIQLNCKLGGQPWIVKIPMVKKIMICGYDTYHDSSRRGRSAGAFVASLNQNCTRWYSRVSFHQVGGWQELSDHMTFNFHCALKKYMEVNKCLPEIIMVYRDGVGDGQIGYVKEWELAQLKKVIKDTIKDRVTKFAFIVVNKRINTRFFRMKDGNVTNPPHGTIIDSVVTRYDRYDFFLVSQLATQGTVSPTMYNIIEDSTGIAPEYIQRLTYKFTHLYFNCSGTISVPAPCQFAHKLAFLAGQSLHQEPKEELCDRLFYL